MSIRPVIPNSQSYEKYTPHEVFLMVKFSSKEAIEEIAQRINQDQFEYVLRASHDNEKIRILDAEWKKTHGDNCEKVTSTVNKKSVAVFRVL
jgi:hypothetical protein